MESVKGFLNRIEKKDYIYWIAFLLFALILSWTIRIDTSTELLDKITFAMGLSSLFLSVIAIFYSIVKGEQSSQQSIIVTETLHKISKSAEEINIIKQDIKDTRSSMDSGFSNLIEILYKVEDAQTNNKTDTNPTPELMNSIKSALFSDLINGKDHDIYYDTRFKLINNYFPESIVQSFVKSRSQELGLRMLGFYRGKEDIIYAAFDGPVNFDFENKFFENQPELVKILKLTQVEEIPIV
ncbi:hypothetical protein M3204_22395 [Mesobacillus subterraneus]|jgi:hypothetical protein|uniref:hypothetical protein n=1 Tax=Mesobacillus subterraneus TaxID=285983 RepID=UPI00203A7185|nr:hypothetical protein [Mesobacillus subterraneus]MCM3667154.1 hypothetical protein [Mesobacillus subterraneus]MCM3685979.1 hypothetical protein [Mesobacillus subterraneus]